MLWNLCQELILLPSQRALLHPRFKAFIHRFCLMHNFPMSRKSCTKEASNSISQNEIERDSMISSAFDLCWNGSLLKENRRRKEEEWYIDEEILLILCFVIPNSPPSFNLRLFLRSIHSHSHKHTDTHK